MSHPVRDAPPPFLTAGQRALVDSTLARVQAARRWHGGLPVLLLDRCWLRLTAVPVADLGHRLPPDSSRDAPELARYRALVADGLTGWQAQQICWQEYGPQACQEALQRFWQRQERGNQGWTLDRYLTLLRDYRARFEQQEPRPFPLIVLAREGESRGKETHGLFWLRPGGDAANRPMRHTCA